TAPTGLLERLVGLEVGGGDDLGQQHGGTDPRNQQGGVLSQPAQAGTCCRRAVEHPAVVDVGLRHVAALTEHREQRLHPLEQDLVVVAAQRVGRDASAGRPPTSTLPLDGGGRIGAVRVGGVGEGERDDA